MKFSKLRINAFNGFADVVELPVQDGLSGIVGPNGYGKSSPVEAIGWLMGENRPSAIRSGAMEDVIFSGSATRTRGALARYAAVLCRRGIGIPVIRSGQLGADQQHHQFNARRP